MRLIENKKWMTKGRKGEEVEESLIQVLNIILNGVDPKDIPKGLDKFRSFSRIAKSFDGAEKTGIIKLEETDFSMLKGLIEKNIPAAWALKMERSEAIISFVEAKTEEK